MSVSEQRLRVRRYFGKTAEMVGSLVLMVLFMTLFVLVFQYVVPFVLAGVLAILFLPVVKWLERRGLPRTASVWIAMVGVGLILVIACLFAAIAIANQATALSSNITPYFLQLQNWSTHLTKLQAVFFNRIPPQVAAQIQTAAQHSLGGIQQGFSRFVSFLLNLVTQFPNWLFIVGIALIATYLILVGRQPMYDRFLRYLPPGWDRKVPAALNDMVRAFMGTLQVQLILMALSAVLAMVAMWILRIPYAFVLGLLFGVSGIIPVVGSAMITIPWAIGALIAGDVSLALKVIVIQIVIALIVHMLTPKVTANHVGLDTLSTLVALYIGMKLIGFIGIFVGPIVLIGIKSFISKRLLLDLFPNMDAGKTEKADP